MSFHKTYSHLVVIWNWRNTYFKLGCVFPLIFHIYCVYTHTYNVCLQGFIHMFTGLLARQCRKLWLALLLLSAKGSSSRLRWSCKLSWKWVSFAVSFPLLWIYISQEVLASALCKWALMRSLNFDNHPCKWHTLDRAVSRSWGRAVFQLWTTNWLKSGNALLGRRIAQWGWLGIHLTGD